MNSPPPASFSQLSSESGRNLLACRSSAASTSSVAAHAAPRFSGGHTTTRALVPSAARSATATASSPAGTRCHGAARVSPAVPDRHQLSRPAGACLTRVTTVLPLTVRVVVVTVTPEAVVVATECVTCGPAAAEVPVVPAAVPAAGAAPAAATPGGRRLVGLVGQRHGGRPGAGDERRGRPVRHPPGVPDAVPAGHARLDGSMFVSFRASACDPRVRERR